MKNRRFPGFSVVLSAALIAPIAMAAAQSSPTSQGAGSSPRRLPQNLLRYLKDKYPLVDDAVVSSLRDTAAGVLGQISIRGSIVPPGGGAVGTREDRARGIAAAFIRAESAALDLPDPSELEEIALRVGADDDASIDYVRTVGGLQLLDSQIHVVMSPDGAITSFEASLRPATADLRRAVGRMTLTRDDVMRIVDRDLAPSLSTSPVRIVSEPVKFASWQAPYVLWRIAASASRKPAWSYTIDAFTGDVIGKNCLARTMTATRGATPCD